MKFVLQKLETGFEKLASTATRIYGHSITFILALCMVLYYVCTPRFYRQDTHDCIKDLITCIMFLSFFIIQKTVNRFSVALQLKVNELVAAHAEASNDMINVEEKTEEELLKLSKHYSELKEKINESSDQKAAHSIDHILMEEEKKRDANQ
jgi:low affinity Fe/Cu permease